MTIQVMLSFSCYFIVQTRSTEKANFLYLGMIIILIVFPTKCVLIYLYFVLILFTIKALIQIKN